MQKRGLMKQLLSIILVLWATIQVTAKCLWAGITVFPSGNTIKQNSIFVIEGYAESQKVILGLNTIYPIYLKSGNAKIKLLVTNTYVGQLHLVQAILKPDAQLEAGVEYTMYIDSLPDFEYIKKYNYHLEKDQVAKYKVLVENDTDKPVLIEKPRKQKKEYILYGCGPAINAIFSYPVKDSSQVMVKTTVKNLKTGIETTYFIKPDEEDGIHVGHGMCGGAFTFKNGRRYEVEFSFMDASGNTTAWKGKRIKFTRPRKKWTIFS
jgi:hypothetical protein